MSANAATLADVTSASWSLMLDATAGGGPGSGIGRVVQGLGDIAQCVTIILTTLPGEDPFRPTFGCDLTRYIDKPIPVAQPAIVAAVFAAIERWEPRITVLGVSAAPAGPSAPGRLTVAVQWRIDQAAIGAPEGRLGAIAVRPANTTTVTV